MKISKRAYVISVLGLFWGLILVSMLLGGWQAKQTADQVVVKSVEDIKGWMKMKEVSKDLGIPITEIAPVLGIKGELDPEKSLKDLAEENDKSPDDYKDLLEKYFESKGGISPKSGETGSDKANEINNDKGETPGTAEENSENIKGYMTFKAVSDLYGIPVKDIFKRLNIPEGQDPKVPMKDLTSKYNFEVQDVRDLVAEYQKAAGKDTP